MARILIIDDEAAIRGALRQLFEYEGHAVSLATGGPSGLLEYEDSEPHITFLDIKMPRMDGLEVLKRIRERDPGAVVVMISGHGTIETALEATRLGAFDFLEKPLDTDRVLVTLRNGLRVRGLSKSVRELEDKIRMRHEIVGSSQAIRVVQKRIETVAPTSARVLITGENGSGKELIARAIHRLSQRRAAPFIEVNCAAIPSELIESELFGHVKGSFTGASEDRAGKFEQADGGSLFLDEVGDMAPKAQAKALRALEDGRITRVGGRRAVSVDVRVIASTNRDLPLEVAEGRFRKDLYYRLNVVPIHAPPLRARAGDISMLVEHFVGLASEKNGVAPKRFTTKALRKLAALEWPGNVRELRNAVERLVILVTGDTVTAVDVDELKGVSGADLEADGGIFRIERFDEFRRAADRVFIEASLRANEWNVVQTAKRLGLSRSGLYKKMELLGIGDG